MKKLFLFTVFVLICALTLCSCAKKTDNLDEFEQLLLSTSDGESENEAFAKLLYVIIPKDCSPDVTARATALAEAIEQKTGIETILKYDNVEVDKGQGIIEILVGKTSRLYSSELTRALRIDDYIFKYERGSVVIGALSDEATLAAIDRFEADVLPGASRSYFMSESTKIEYFGEYEFDSVRLDGYDIREYNICYNSEKEYDMACALRDYIAQRSGCRLSLRDYRTMLDRSGKNIVLIMNELRDLTADAVVSGKTVELVGGDSYLLSMAFAGFVQDLFDADGGREINATFGERTSYYNDEPDLSLTLCSLSVSGEAPTLDFCATLALRLLTLESDIVYFTDLTPELLECISDNFGEGYQLLSVKCSDGREIYLLYDNSEVEILSTDFYDGVLKLCVRSDGVEWSIVDDRSCGVDKAVSAADANGIIITEENAFYGNYDLACSFGEYGAWVQSGAVNTRTEETKTDTVSGSTMSFAYLTLNPALCDEYIALKNAGK